MACLALSVALSSGCQIVEVDGGDAGDAGDAGAVDGTIDGEAGLDWLTVCKQYYAQPGVATSTCTDCENGVCSAQTLASLNACGDSTDSECLNTCKGATPENENCTCLEGCLTTPCETAMATTESCEMSACSSSCD
jgi:hypothetical protein